MAFETLFLAAVKAFIGLLVKAGFEDKINAIKQKLIGGKESKQKQTLEKAYTQVIEAVGDDNLAAFLKNESVVETLTASMLNPAGALNLESIAVAAGDTYSQIVGALLGRNRNNPDNRNNNIGFRVALSTFFNCWNSPAAWVCCFRSEAKNGGAYSRPHSAAAESGK